MIDGALRRRHLAPPRGPTLCGRRRSRTDVIGIPAFWWLETAPRPDTRRLLGAFAVEVVAGVVAASIRPFTEVAFGILAPMFGLGLMGLWAVRSGTFPPPPDAGT